MSINSWMKGFIGMMLGMTHTQCMYRNFSKHHHAHGSLQLKKRREIHTEIERQLDKGLDTLPKESRCLLEIDTCDLFQLRTTGQQYWMHAIKAARTAGQKALELSAGETTSWKKIVNGPMLDGLLRHNPTPPEAPLPPATTPPAGMTGASNPTPARAPAPSKCGKVTARTATKRGHKAPRPKTKRRR